MQVIRHGKLARVMHWFNALCWLALLATGFGMLRNESVRPFGDTWAQLWLNADLLLPHIVLGLLWACGMGLCALIGLKSATIPFLREIFRLHPRQDAVWCLRKGLWLVLGARLMRRLGLDPELPPQGFYNAGQKYAAILAVASSAVLVASGTALAFGARLQAGETLMQAALLVHLVSAGLMAVALPVHVYMAAAAPGEYPALVSMFTGKIPLEHLRHHNPLWYAALTKNDAAPPCPFLEGTPPPQTPPAGE
jgi:formate dehydrogenase subunit gamma